MVKDKGTKDSAVVSWSSSPLRGSPERNYYRKQRQDRYFARELKKSLEVESLKKDKRLILKQKAYKWLVSYLKIKMAVQAQPIGAALQTVPITVNLGQANDRPFSVAPFPLFTGRQGSDPDGHLAQFITSCIANNARTEEHWKTMFPATLRDLAFQWYDRQAHGHFPDWATLKAEFLAQFRPIGFADRSREQLNHLSMVLGESVDSYAGRLEDILRRWNNHNVPNHMQMSSFIEGLQPIDVIRFVKEGQPNDLQAAINRAKLWEQINVVTRYGDSRPTAIPVASTSYSHINESYPVRSVPVDTAQMTYLPVPVLEHQNPMGPPIAINTSVVPRNLGEEAIISLAKKFDELAVHLAANKAPRPKVTNVRANIWCTNCQGYGHLANECPTPIVPLNKIRCSYCQGRHHVNDCWHLHGKPGAPIGPDVATSWGVNQVGSYPNQRPWRTNNPRFNNQRWGSNLNGPMQPNVPPQLGGGRGNPNGPRTQFRRNRDGTFPVCYRCQELGHYASECPNPKKEIGFIPLCGNCKEQGHWYYNCPYPKRPQQERPLEPQADVAKGDDVNTTAEANQRPCHKVEIDSPRPGMVNVVTRARQKESGASTELRPDECPQSVPMNEQLSFLNRPNRAVTFAELPTKSGNPLSMQSPIVTSKLPIVPTAIEEPAIAMDQLWKRPIVRTPPQTNGKSLIDPMANMERHNEQRASIPRPTIAKPIGGQQVKSNRFFRKKRAMGISSNMNPYNIINDMDNMKPEISLRQLLTVAPECRSTLNNALIRKRNRIIDSEVHEISLNPDPGTPTIDVIIDGVVIPGVQVDGGSSVNLMNADTMSNLDLLGLTHTGLVLRMADQSRVKPMGILPSVLTIIAGIEYKIDYIVFKLNSSSFSYPILLGRPWLYQAKAKNDWGRGTLTIGSGSDKIVMQMYPTIYQGETQEEGDGYTSDNNYDQSSDLSDHRSIEVYTDRPFVTQEGVRPKMTRSGQVYKCTNLGEYWIPQVDTDESDHAIEEWLNSRGVYAVQIEMEPLMLSTSDELDMLYNDEDGDRELIRAPQEVQMQELNLGTQLEPQMIIVYKDITEQELTQWMQFFQEHKDNFAWTYKDLRGIPSELCEHRIVLEDNARPVRQRQHRLNPKYSLMVKEELDKLLKVGFIYAVPYSEWVSPIVMVPKKNGKIRICQDFRKLNAVTRKDYFPLPFTDSILDAVAGHECYSFLDGFSGYNQIKIALEDQLKTTFTTDWGTFAYTVMPFGLCNAPATFQRVMTRAFQDYLRQFMEIFLDDFCVFSTKADHEDKLARCFAKCKEYGISLNSGKCQFLVPLGKLLGHIVSKDGITTDPAKVYIILALPLPATVKDVRAFLGHVGYYRRFILDFALIASPLTTLLKNDEEQTWTNNCTRAFEDLKLKLATAPILVTPDWTKEFYVYVDASNVALGSVLSQKDTKKHDHPIYFASRQLVAAEKNYSTTEREALGMIYSVQKFRHYLLGYHFTFYVDHDALKYLVNKPQISGRIARWVLLLQEFQYTIIVRPGKQHANADHLSRLTDKLGDDPINDELPDAQLFVVEVVSNEYADIINYLSLQILPPHFTPKQQRQLIYVASLYTIIGGTLYKLGKDEILRRCIMQSEVPSILEGCHDDPCGGHFAGDSTARKALTSGYWWATMFADAHNYVKKCDACQRIGKPTISMSMPLVPILAEAPFEKWGIDFVGPIAPASRNGQKRYILVATEYVTKWAEAIATRKDDANTVAQFLFENIITRFGCPLELVSDRGTHFLNSTIEQLTTNFLIKHRKTTPYHPRANGQTEKTNGLLCRILTKTIIGTGTDWDHKLYSALWAYRTAYKVTTNSTPFQLVYGIEAILPIELEVQSLRVAIQERLNDDESLSHRLAMLERLDEVRSQALLNIEATQKRRKLYYDSKLKPKPFKENDLVLLYDTRFQKFPGKLKIRWLGPYRVIEVFSNGSILVADLEGHLLPTRINGDCLKLYHN